MTEPGDDDVCYQVNTGEEGATPQVFETLDEAMRRIREIIEDGECGGPCVELWKFERGDA